MKNGLLTAFTVLLFGQPLGALAAVSIVIDRGYDNPEKIAVVPFAVGTGITGDNPASIIAFDLARSGQFAPTATENMLSLPTKPTDVLFRDWRTLGDKYVVIGKSELESNGNLSVTYYLFDVFNERQLASEKFSGPITSAREIAHLVSDSVYEKLTGIPGAFSTRLIYVVAKNLGTPSVHFTLEMSDVDGERPKVLLESREPILSASWSPDSKSVVYVSFESGKPAIILQEIATGNRTVLTNFPGLNGAPVFSPDGRQLALVLSRDGNPEIYVMDLGTRDLKRITRNQWIDTEPAWTADGKGLIFTSDRGGKPQIYQVDIASGLTQRLTFEGDYNARGRLLPDGKHLVFVHRNDGVFHIAMMDLDRGTTMILTTTSLDESPSIAPNGQMLIYATQDKGRGILAVVSIDGRVKYRLPSSAGDVREPAWSPFMNRPRT